MVIKKKEFLESRNDFNKIEVKNKIRINAFCYENKLTYPVHISDQKFKTSMNLLIIPDKTKSHYVYIKDFNKFIFNKTKNKTKKYFCKYCLQCFSSERILVEHKENCSKINGEQTVQLKVALLNSKVIPDKYQFHLKFTLILSVF